MLAVKPQMKDRLVCCLEAQGSNALSLWQKSYLNSKDVECWLSCHAVTDKHYLPIFNVQNASLWAG